MLRHINQFISLFIESIKQLGRGRIWFFLLGYFFILWLILLAHYKFLSPVSFVIIKGWVSLFGESAYREFTHYPQHLRYLPFYFGIARLLPGIILEGLVLGGVALAFADGFYLRQNKEYIPARSLFASWLNLIIIWVIINGLTMVLNWFLPEWLQFFHQDSPRRLLAMEFLIMPGIFTVVLALFYYTIPSIALFGDNFLRAIGRSFRYFFRRPLTSLFLAGIILIGPYIISAIVGRSEYIIERFRPEMVYWLLVVGLVVDMLANFFWIGTATRFLLDEEE